MANLKRPAPQHNEPDRVIGRIKKNAQENITVSLRTYEGYRFADLRVMAGRPDGKLLPTGKGVTMKADALPHLIGLLQRTHAAAVEAGWYNGDAV